MEHERSEECINILVGEILQASFASSIVGTILRDVLSGEVLAIHDLVGMDSHYFNTIR